MGVGQARGKLLLFGEHAAVYGHPAVGFTLPWTLQIAHTRGQDWTIPGLGRHEAAVRDLLGRLEGLAREEGLRPPTPGRLEITTSIPIGSGFGSSAALCAALVNLFWTDLPLAQRDVLAWKTEGQFHGTPSGIDTALALREGWWALDPSTRPVGASPLPDPNLALVVAAVNRESNAKALIGSLARKRQEGDPGINGALEALGALSCQALKALAGGGASIVPLVHQARRSLRSLGLESPPMTQVLDGALEKTGALAGKLSGAGGGGAFFLLYPDSTSAQSAIWVLENLVPRETWVQPPTVISSPPSVSTGPEGGARTKNS